jgi:hypothetical protein
LLALICSEIKKYRWLAVGLSDDVPFQKLVRSTFDFTDGQTNKTTLLFGEKA